MSRMTSGARRLALATTLVPALGAATVLALAAPAGAAAPTRIDAEYWSASCVTGLGDGLTLFLFGSGTTDGAEGGVGAFIEDAQGGIVAEGQADSYGFGPVFTAGIDLGGTRFTLSADVARGESLTEVVDERDGNKWTKGTTTRTELALSPTSASYGGAAIMLDPAACNGDINEFHTRSTNPAAYVSSSDDFGSEICDVDGLADAQVRVSGALPNPYVELVLDHGGEDVEKAQGEVRLKGARGTLTAPVRDLFTGETRTTATIGLTLTAAAKKSRTVESADGMVERRTYTPYREAITVAFADGRRGSVICSGMAVTTQTRIKPAK